jgi:hypothetical protein
MLVWPSWRTVHGGEVVVGARGVTKSYGSVRVLDGVDLEVHRGEVVAVISLSAVVVDGHDPSRSTSPRYRPAPSCPASCGTAGLELTPGPHVGPYPVGAEPEPYVAEPAQ